MRGSFEVRLCGHHRVKSNGDFNEVRDQQSLILQGIHWANLSLQLLCDVINRLETSGSTWPARKHVVTSAAVSRKIRTEIVQNLEFTRKLACHVFLKQMD